MSVVRGRDMSTLAVSGAILTLNLATGILAARALGTTGRGQLAAILAMPQLLGWVLAMSAGEAISYRQSKAPSEASQLLGSWLAMLAPLCLIGVLVAELLVPVVLPGASSGVERVGRIYVISVALTILGEPFTGSLLGDRRFVIYNGMRLAQPVLTVLAFLLLSLSETLTVESAAVTALLAFVITSGVTVAAVIRRHRIARPDLAVARATLSYGLRAHGSDLMGIVNERADLLIVAAVLGSAGAGAYSVATNVAGSILGLLGALSVVLVPAATGADGLAAIARSMRLVWAIAIPLAVVLALIAGPLVRGLYGREFEAAVLPLQLLLPGVVLLTAGAVLGAGLRAMGRPLTASFPQVIALVVTLGGLALFLEEGGLRAAALVATAAYATAFLVTIGLYRSAAGSAKAAFGFGGEARREPAS